ncbi:hyphally regulated cell wall protein 1-like isoform X4 [Lytechinus variegatus]|uniref:hyphally regulated cell wall protein 1-like isoform X4 n=1 Tax=Lytechinus variegatus TaxID=7654 RepID=UPI001BB206BD|nr:hyphally regulated cell wall protein 1-like isoform X4 [Lytechinus variegatus]
MFRLLILVALLGFGLLHVEADSSSSESGSNSRERIQWGTRSITNPGGRGSNRVESDGGPLQRTELLTGLQPPCTVTANFNSDAETAILNFCANQLDTTDPTSVDTADCYDLEISSTNAPSRVWKDGQIIQETAPQPFFEKGVLTVLEITIDFSKCTVLNKNNDIEIPIESPNEISFRYLYVSTTTGQRSTIDAQEVPDSEGSNSGDSGSNSGNSGSNSGNSGSNSGNSGSNSGNSGSNSGNSGSNSGNSGSNSGNSGSNSGNSGSNSGNSGSNSGNSGSNSGNSVEDSNPSIDGGDEDSNSGNSGSNSGNSVEDSNPSVDGGDEGPDAVAGDSGVAVANPPPPPPPGPVECATGPQFIGAIDPVNGITVSFTIVTDADVFIVAFSPKYTYSGPEVYQMRLSAIPTVASVVNLGSVGVCDPVPVPFLLKNTPNRVTVTISRYRCDVTNDRGAVLAINSINESDFRYIYGSCINGNYCAIHCLE